MRARPTEASARHADTRAAGMAAALDSRSRRQAALVLAIVLPAPVLGTAAGMVLAPGTLTGTVVFTLAKLWLLAIPIAWHLRVDRKPLHFLRPTPRSLAVGVLTGLGMAATIFAAFYLFSKWIDPTAFRAAAIRVGLADRRVFIIGAVYWSLVNALLEEYVWRWFVAHQFARLGGTRVAVLASAAAFTLHHVVALQVYFSSAVTALAAFGVFLGGCVWAAFYLNYRNIWPGYCSHVVADAAIFALGYRLLF